MLDASRVNVVGALLLGPVLAVAVLISGPVSADVGVDTGSDSTSCPKLPEQAPRLVPGAEVQDGDCLRDLTTAGTEKTGHTNRQDWDGLNAEGYEQP